MNEKITIKNATFKNIMNFDKPLLLLIFIFYCVFTIDAGKSMILQNLLIFICVVGVILTIFVINYFSTIVVIDESGIEKKSLLFKHIILWTNIKSLDIQLTTAKRLTTTLEKKDYFEEFFIGKKEILISDLENQLNQSTYTRWKKIIRLPFSEKIIEIMKSKNQF